MVKKKTGEQIEKGLSVFGLAVGALVSWSGWQLWAESNFAFSWNVISSNSAFGLGMFLIGLFMIATSVVNLRQ